MPALNKFFSEKGVRPRKFGNFGFHWCDPLPRGSCRMPDVGAWWKLMNVCFHSALACWGLEFMPQWLVFWRVTGSYLKLLETRLAFGVGHREERGGARWAGITNNPVGLWTDSWIVSSWPWWLKWPGIRIRKPELLNDNVKSEYLSTSFCCIWRLFSKSLI